jgi:hypothetical protein
MFSKKASAKCGGMINSDMVNGFQKSYTMWSKRFGVQRISEIDVMLKKMIAQLHFEKPCPTKLILKKCGVTNVQAVALAEALAK